jgi:hypothetical protein
MMSTEQRQKKVGDAILLERAAQAVRRNYPFTGRNRQTVEWLRAAAIMLRREGENGEPDR